MNAERRVVGTEAKRQDGIAKVTGTARFAIDLSVPGMAHAVVLRSTRAHARITRIERGAARRAHGVLAVITGDDLLAAGLTPYYGHVVLDRPPGRRRRLPLPDAVRLRDGAVQLARLLRPGRSRRVLDRAARVHGPPRSRAYVRSAPRARPRIGAVRRRRVRDEVVHEDR